VTPEWSEEAAALFRRAVKNRLAPAATESTVLDRRQIEAVLPHRDPFLLVHRITHLDVAGGLVVGRYPLSAAQAVFRGHFPEHPVYPGALQIEAIGQVGIVLWLLQHRSGEHTPKKLFLTHVLGARFLHPVGPGGELEVAVTTLDDDGLFTTAVGQCIWNGVICSAGAVSCVIDDDP
jgi:3-hydroxyacyl-[acyl-carrier-protein] dehydratase